MPGDISRLHIGLKRVLERITNWGKAKPALGDVASSGLAHLPRGTSKCGAQRGLWLWQRAAGVSAGERNDQTVGGQGGDAVDGKGGADSRSLPIGRKRQSRCQKHAENGERFFSHVNLR